MSIYSTFFELGDGGDCVQLAYIPDHIRRPKHKRGFVRLDVNDSTVVLTTKQVKSLRDALTWWLEAERLE